MIQKAITAGGARLTIVETLYHQQAGAQPTASSSRYTRSLTSDEQTYTRRITLGEEWTPIPLGWLTEETVGMLKIANERPLYEVIPTDEQKLQDTLRYIELAILPPERPEDNPKVRDMFSPPKVKAEPSIFGLIPPGEDARFTPRSIVQMRMRCMLGTVKAIIMVVPN